MNYQGLDSKNLVLNLLGQDANIQVNKKILLTLGLEEAFYLSYLINQYKYFLAEGSLREDDSFYASNSDISLFTTLNNSQIQRGKKSLIEKEFFKISIEGIPSVTYYYLNFEKILQIVASEKTNLELAYKNVYNETINFEISSQESIFLLEKLTYKELRFFCKENKIKYSGNDTKRHLIYKIVENKNPSLLSTPYFFTVDDISSTSGSEIRPLSKMGGSEELSGSKTRPLVDAKSIPNLKQINQEQKKNHDHEEHELDFHFEKTFHELGVHYTKTNKESIEKLLQKMKPYEVERYIRELHKNLKENPDVKDVNALFSVKIQRQECQINTPKKEEVETSKSEVKKTTYTREDIKNELSKYNVLHQRSLFEKVKEEFLKVASKEDTEYLFNVIEDDITGFTSLTQLKREWIKVLFQS